MTIETYKVTLKHDDGTKRLTISPFTSEESAIIAVMAIEYCPRCAIVKIKKIRTQMI